MLTIHADRSSSMKSKPGRFVAQRPGRREVALPSAREQRQPYSESHFRTLKYRPAFPDRFGSIEHGRPFCGTFFPWYNTEHHHSALGWHTPEDVHYGDATIKRDARAAVLTAAYVEHPARFVRRPPTPPPELPTAVWINAPIASPQEALLSKSPRSTVADP